jgi:2,3-dihydroxybenzoate-AMP ligase
MHRAEVARFKYPDHLVFVSELPSTKVGKIDKKALRDDIVRRLALAGQAGQGGLST